MNIFVLILFLSLSDVPSLPVASRANRRASRSKAIARNRRTAKELNSSMPWFDEPYHNEAHQRFQHPELEGKYVSYHSGQIYTHSQQGRWDDYQFGGHRRYAKWEKKAYPSGKDAFATSRWEEELKEYLNS